MGISRHKYPEFNFALTRIVGDIDDSQLKQYVLEANRDSEDLSALRALADCRKVESVSSLSVQGTIDAASYEENQPRVKGGRLAILIVDSPLIFGLARVYQSIASMNWQDVEIFKDPLKALGWLGFGEGEMPRMVGFLETAGIDPDR